jgi:protein-tyrosine-phosphatase
MNQEDVEYWNNAPMHELLSVCTENSPRAFLARQIIQERQQERQSKRMEKISFWSAMAAGLSAIVSIIQLFAD